MAKKKKKQRTAQSTAKVNDGVLETADDKVMRLAHKILTKTIWPADLSLEEAVDVAIVLVKSLVLSNTEDADPDDRADMIEWIEGRFLTEMDELNPNADRPHVWLVSPQGLITEPVGFLWAGSDGGGVEVLMGADLDGLRAELDETCDGAGAIVTDGVEGLAITDPTWDGDPTVTCANLGCGKEHDVHLMVAENLFREAKHQPLPN